MKRKMEAVAAHGSKSKSRFRGSSGVVDLMGGLALADKERCLASCPADMAETSLSASIIRSAPRSTIHWCGAFGGGLIFVLQAPRYSIILFFLLGRETAARSQEQCMKQQALTRPIFVTAVASRIQFHVGCRRADPGVSN